jgi:hypothetical protein
VGQLQLGGGDDGPAVCAVCGADAAGPCAQCRVALCPDCCTIVPGAARSYALCPDCAKSGGAELRAGWLGLLRWVMLPIGALAVVVLLLEQCR